MQPLIIIRLPGVDPEFCEGGAGGGGGGGANDNMANMAGNSYSKGVMQ